jgi:sugar-specific transcriptional regulator TrmB
MARTYVVPQSTPALIQGGLTPAQASLYETLIQQGQLNARRASFIAGVPRTLGYKILGELEALGLVVKNDKPGKVAEFSAAHPAKLKELAEKRFEQARDAKVALESAVFKLISDFDRVSALQGVKVIEGASGLRDFVEKTLFDQKPLVTKVVKTGPKELTFSVIFE